MTSEQIRELRKRLVDQIFAIAVVGEFNRGKSTVINALIGEEILPASIFPSTATLNRVTYGHDKKVKIVFKKTDHEPEMAEDIPISALAEYVTKLTEESEAIAERVQEAVVYYPVPICYQFNMDIIDTPGLNDEANLSEITINALKKVDAAILVLFADAPFAASEGQFLDRLLDLRLGKIIYAVTALDRIRRPEDRERVLQDVATRISERIQRFAEAEHPNDADACSRFLQKIGAPRVFGLSGHLALEGKQTNNAELLHESQFVEFESGLRDVLTNESEAVTLRSRMGQVYAACRQIHETCIKNITAAEKQRAHLRKTSQINTALLESLQHMGNSEARRLIESKNSYLKDVLSLSGWKHVISHLQDSWDKWQETSPVIANSLYRYAITYEALLALVQSELSSLASPTIPKSIRDIAAQIPTTLGGTGFITLFGGQEGFEANGRLEQIWATLGVTENKIKEAKKNNQMEQYLDGVFGDIMRRLEPILNSLPDKRIELTAVIERLNAAVDHQLGDFQNAQQSVEKFELKWRTQLGMI